MLGSKPLVESSKTNFHLLYKILLGKSKRLFFYVLDERELQQHTSFCFQPGPNVNVKRSSSICQVALNPKILPGPFVMEQSQESILFYRVLYEKEEAIVDKDKNIFDPIMSIGSIS